MRVNKKKSSFSLTVCKGICLFGIDKKHSFVDLVKKIHCNLANCHAL